MYNKVVCKTKKLFNMKNLVVIAVVLLAGILFLTSGTKTVLSGKVRDEAGMNVMYCSLDVYSQENQDQAVYSTTTDLNGQFKINNLQPGTYKLVLKAEGFKDKVEWVDFKKGNNYLTDLRVKGNVTTLMPAVIYAKAF